MKNGPVEPTDWYSEAWIYDLAFGYEPRHDANVLREACERFEIEDGAAILEPMIGTGRLAPPLLERGYSVYGYDLSLPMLRRAAARAPEARLFQADAARVHLAPRFALAHCLIDSFRYLIDPRAAAAFFDATIEALVPGGVFLLGLLIEGEAPPEPERWTVREGHRTAHVHVYNEGRPGPQSRWLVSEVQVEDGATTRTFRSRRAQRIWTAPELRAFLAARRAGRPAGAWLRTGDLRSPCADLPRHGGSVILAFER